MDEFKSFFKTVGGNEGDTIILQGWICMGVAVSMIVIIAMLNLFLTSVNYGIPRGRRWPIG